MLPNQLAGAILPRTMRAKACLLCCHRVRQCAAARLHKVLTQCSCSHVNELDVVQLPVSDGLIHLLILANARPEVVQCLQLEVTVTVVKHRGRRAEGKAPGSGCMAEQRDAS